MGGGGGQEGIACSGRTVMREVRCERGHVPWCGSIGRSVTHFLTGITDFKSHDLNLEYVEHHRLTSEQREEGTVYIDKNITLVGGDSKRIRLNYKYVN